MRLKTIKELRIERVRAMERARYCRMHYIDGYEVDVQMARRFNRMMLRAAA